MTYETWAFNGYWGVLMVLTLLQIVVLGLMFREERALRRRVDQLERLADLELQAWADSQSYGYVCTRASLAGLGPCKRVEPGAAG